MASPSTTTKITAAVIVVILAVGIAAFTILQPKTQPTTITVTRTETVTITVTQASPSPFTPSIPHPTTQVSLNGAGATFPYPLISVMTSEYNKIRSNVRINYQSIGSGGGIRQHTEKTVDFGASDQPLTEAQRNSAPDTLHIPITIGSVVLVYNIPGLAKGLKLTGPIIADIFLGKITKWNDPAIKALNPDLTPIDRAIIVAHRSDGSGTTFIWTSYLSVVSPEWKEKVGRGTAVQWPIGLGAAGNEGVARIVRDTEYALGYVEFAYALQNKMAYAYIQNREGRFIEPSIESTAAAVQASAVKLPRGDESWAGVSLLDAPGADSYPIASFSYILVYKELSVLRGMDEGKAKALVDFLWWAIHDGQKYAPDLEYVPLPQPVITLNESTLRMITINGKPLI